MGDTYFGKNDASSFLHWKHQSTSPAFRALRGGLMVHKMRTQRGHRKTHQLMGVQQRLRSAPPQSRRSAESEARIRWATQGPGSAPAGSRTATWSYDAAADVG